MKTHAKQVVDNVFVFSIWDDSWNAYNNCYLIRDNEAIILIDGWKEEHAPILLSLFSKIDISPLDITHFIATHGHRDHIGGIQSLGEVEGYIHPQDLHLVPEKMKQKFHVNLPDEGQIIGGLQCIRLGHHTEGSVLLYLQESKLMFCGDHVCFFGEPLSGGIVDIGMVEMEKYKQFVVEWSANEEMKKEHRFDLFINGLEVMNRYDMEYLSTGHGVVLKGDINKFISDLIQFGNQELIKDER